MTSRQSCTWAGCGAMATAFGDAAARLSTESPAPGEPTTRANQLTCASLRFKQDSRARNVRPARSAHFARSRSRAGPRPHPPQAPGLHSRRSPPMRSFAGTTVALYWWRARMSLQRRARPGRGANKAQAPAVDGLAAQRRLRAPTGAKRAVRTFHARKTCLSRNAVKASCFARAARPFSAGNSVESRAAALPNAVAIAPRPGRVRRCREVKERPHAAARPCAALPRGQGATAPQPGRVWRCREVKERPRRGPAVRGVAARTLER